MTVKSSMRAGFTLVEIMIVIAIIGAILAVAIPANNRRKEQASETTTKATLRVLKVAIEDFNEAIGRVPDKLQDLITKPGNLDPETADKWDEFLDSKKIPKDGWNRPFEYKTTSGADHEYELYSLGSKDKKKGGKISVWNL